MGKIFIQAIIEEILLKHGIDPSAHEFYLKLSMPIDDDLNLVVGKFGEQIIIDLEKDELAFDYNEGHWFGVGMGNIICSFFENGNRMVIPYRLKRFMIFQANLAKKIQTQKWLEKGVKIQEAIVSDLFFISKDAPNPFVMGKCKSDYANPNEEE